MRDSTQGRARWLRGGLGLVASGVALLFIAWSALGLGLWRMPGVRWQGRVLPAHASPALRQHAQFWSEQSLTLRVGYHVFEPARAELGFGLWVSDAERELRELGRSRNPLISLRALAVALFGAGHELSWRPRVISAGALERFLERVRDQVERLPVPGGYAPDGTKVPGLAGEAVDIGQARRAIERAVVQGATALTIPTLVIPPPRGYRRFERRMAQTDVLMTMQETAYRPGTGRATNIELAARSIDGTLLMPSEGFSFNAVVGKRLRSRGFAPALELMGGELVQGVGGGVCQVAGTLHAAAFFAGLAVEEYHAHSRWSRLAYLPPGLDAMVAWPDEVHELRDTKDMRLRNPYPFPVRIAARVVAETHHNLLRVALYGAARPFRVDFKFVELSRTKPDELRRVDVSVPSGEVRVQQDGLDGLVIARRRTVYTPLGRVEEETRVAYPPTPRILRVGPTQTGAASGRPIAAK